jgi:hypothetical protein
MLSTYWELVNGFYACDAFSYEATIHAEQFYLLGGMIKSKVFEVLNLILELSGSPAQ